MRQVLLDNHLLRDLLIGETSPALERVLEEHVPATTNLYLTRLCRSVVSAAGGSLTTGLASELPWLHWIATTAPSAAESDSSLSPAPRQATARKTPSRHGCGRPRHRPAELQDPRHSTGAHPGQLPLTLSRR